MGIVLGFFVCFSHSFLLPPAAATKSRAWYIAYGGIIDLIIIHQATTVAH